MRTKSVVAVTVMSMAMAGTSHADFKYTEQTKMTGGALAGVTKTLGVFSKSARQANEPQSSTTMVKGNRMRTEQSGSVEIIDLDGRRFIHVDTTNKTYTIQTFDQLKQQIAEVQAKAKEEQAKSVSKKDDRQNVTMVPKFDMQATGQTRTVMNIPAKEIKMRIDMLLQSTDPKTQADLEKSNASFWMNANSWYGTIPGYDEVREFNKKLAKELNWLPGSMGIKSNPQMAQASEEMRINATKVDGMPLVQFTSMGMTANGQQGAGQNASTQTPPPQQTASNDDSTPTNPRDAVAKSIGGLFKKKQQQNDSNANSNASANGVPAPAPVPGSLIEAMTEVTSYSKDSLDGSLFDVPAGYAQVQADATPATTNK